MANAVAPASIRGLSSPLPAAVWKQVHFLLTCQSVNGDRVLSPRPAAFPSPHLLASAHILSRHKKGEHSPVRSSERATTFTDPFLQDVVITVLFCELL